MKYKGDLYPGLHEAIISKDLFERVQKIRKRNARRPRAMGTTNRIFLLSALGRCSTCGRTLRAQGKVGRRYAYYREVSRDRGFEDCPHSGTGIRQDMVEAQLGVVMMHFVLPEGWQQEIRQELGQYDLQAQVLSERKRLERRLQRVGELYADGIYDHMAYRNERDDVRNKLAHLVVPEPSNVLDAGKQLETVGDVWPDASEEEQQQLCRLMLQAVYIDVAGKRIVRIVPHSDFNILFRYHPYLESQEDGGYKVMIPDSVLDSIQF